MQNWRLLLIFLLLSLSGFSQINKGNLGSKGRIMNGRQLNDTIGEKFVKEKEFSLEKKTHYTDYKIISYSGDITIVDTTLSYKKEQLFNHLRQHNFELLPLHNLGQTYTKLGYDFNTLRLSPEMGVREKYYDFITKDEVFYYHVPTPTSELFYKTGIQQGQVLNSYLTSNLTPELNVSIGYKGLRSLGTYRSALASRQNFRLTTHYLSKDKAYQLRVHFVSHNLMNEENGGIKSGFINFYTSNDSDYLDRGRIATNYTGAESELLSKRYFVDNNYKFWQTKDSLNAKESYLKIGHEFVYSKSSYKFTQSHKSDYIGDAYQNTILDSTSYRTMANSIYARLKSNYILGSLGVKAGLNHYNYGYNSVIILEEGRIPQRIKTKQLSFETDWKAHIKQLALNTQAGIVLEGGFHGNYFRSSINYTKDSLFTAKVTLMAKSQSPNFNFLLYQSDYIDYNWYNTFENENTRYLGFDFQSDKLLNLKASLTQKDYYTYFDTQSKPQQYTDVLSYVKLQAQRDFQLKKFTFDSTVLYQKAITGGAVFRVPEVVTENSIYYSDFVFAGDPLYLQTGFTFRYFTQYKANEFNPLLNEFVLQDDFVLGSYPLVDFFVNGQIRRTRLFVKAENITSFWQHNQFVTPTHVYRDFTVRFGVVWNFFI